MIDFSDIHRLISQPDADKTLSLYLMVDAARIENHSGIPGWRIWLKNALSELEAAHPGDATLAELRRTAEAHLEHARPESKALALFVTPSGTTALPLPVPITGNSASYGRAALGPLLWVMDEYERTLVVVVDKEKARFISGYLGHASREGAHANDFALYDFPEKTQMPTGRFQGDRYAGGSNRDAFDATATDHLRRFFQEVAAQVRQLAEETRVARVFLGGPEEAVHGLRHALHEEVARKVAGIVAIPNYVDDREVLRRVQPVAFEVERARELELVQQVVDLAKSGHEGALGHAAIAECLERRQVELLVLAWPVEDPEIRDRLPREALAAGAKIELVAGPAAERLLAEGGVGARLYYAIKPEREAPRA
jgi:hypothetical protein